MEDQIPIAPWSGQLPCHPFGAAFEGANRAFHTQLPPPSPGVGLEIGVGRERSTGGLPLFLVTDFTGYVITFKILGASYERS